MIPLSGKKGLSTAVAAKLLIALHKSAALGTGRTSVNRYWSGSFLLCHKYLHSSIVVRNAKGSSP